MNRIWRIGSLFLRLDIAASLTIAAGMLVWVMVH